MFWIEADNEVVADQMIRWTARLAVLTYLVRVAWDVSGSRCPRMARTVRLVWGMGGILYGLHVLAAFHFLHQWDHVAAWQHVAEQTELATGWRSGVGLWLNHLVTVIWLVDASAWAWSLNWSNRPLARWLLHPYISFITFNATVIFGPPFWQWVAVILAVSLFVVVRWKRSFCHSPVD